MSLQELLRRNAEEAIKKGMEKIGLGEVKEIRLQPPAEASMGDLGMPCHPYARILRKNPKLIAEDLAAQLDEIEGFSSIEALNGYLNLRFDPHYVIPKVIEEIWEAGEKLGYYDDHADERLLIEFSGPNTNKPQHLGHVRNNVIGLAMSNLLEAVGYDVIRTNIINDRGIHICKSMLAYELWGKGETPESVQRKGDFLVGDYYVLFDKKFNEEYEDYLEKHPDIEISKEDYFNQYSTLGKQAKEMLQAWEAGDEKVRKLWKKMNGWVFEGFDETYTRLGIKFDWIDYESDTYLLGKDLVVNKLEEGLFEKREDGAVICDLTKIGKDGQKVLLRPDGTSVYITQDIGTAMRRFEKFDPQRMIYVVADEQNYHFEILFGILDLIEKGLGERCYHLSYGMVDLPDGKMKSREGTVVDADTLMDELRDIAAAKIKENFPDLDDEEIRERAEKIGQAGLKFFLLKYTPSSRIKFDPAKSIEFQGETGPYCLYSYARGNSIATKVHEQKGIHLDTLPSSQELTSLGSDKEFAVVKVLMEFPQIIRDAAEQYNPAKLAQYLWKLANTFSKFYQDDQHVVLSSPSPLLEARLALIKAVQLVLKRGLAILGFDTIERM